MTIEFVGDLPPRKTPSRGPRPSHPVVDELKSKPGQWARITELTTSAIGSAGTRLRQRGCETASRKIDGKFWLFARWPEGGAS